LNGGIIDVTGREMGEVTPISRVERILRVIALVGSVIGAAWGIQWIVRVGAPFGKEWLLQLMFSFIMTVQFGRRARGFRPERWSWVHIASLSAIWAWRCHFKQYQLGVAAFSILAGLAMVGLVLASWEKRATQHRVETLR
jgi:hypothetical protein